MSESTAIYAPVGLFLTFLLILLVFGLGFAIEESYSNWPQEPRSRHMPVVALYAAIAESAVLIAAIFRRAWRRSAIVGFIAAVAVVLVAFFAAVKFDG